MESESKSFWQKNKSRIIWGSVVGLFVIIYMWMSISYNNYANRTEVAAKSKTKACKVDYDDMWKTIKQQAGVVDKYQESFNKIYSDLIAGRYSDKDGQGQLMSWIQEHNPQFDPSMFKQLMNTIESKRTDFATRQKELIAIQDEYNQTIVAFPGSWFLSNRKEMDVQIITSTKTEEVYKTGKEDDIEVF